MRILQFLLFFHFDKFVLASNIHLHWERLTEYVNKTGNVSPKIDLKSGNHGLGVFAKEEIEHGDEIFFIPQELIISYEDIISVFMNTRGSI